MSITYFNLVYPVEGVVWICNYGGRYVCEQISIGLMNKF